MSVKTRKEPAETSGLTKAFQKAKRPAFYAVFLLAASIAGCAAHDKGVAWLSSPDSYAEIQRRDGTRERVEGKGLHLFSPLTTRHIDRWNPESQTVHFMSWPDEPNYLKVEVHLSYKGIDDFWTYSSVRRSSRDTGNVSLKDLFVEQNWNTYAMVNPEAHPDNAAAVCARLQKDIAIAMDPHYARDLKVTQCNITAYDRPRTRKGYLPN